MLQTIMKMKKLDFHIDSSILITGLSKKQQIPYQVIPSGHRKVLLSALFALKAKANRDFTWVGNLTFDWYQPITVALQPMILTWFPYSYTDQYQRPSSQ